MNIQEFRKQYPQYDNVDDLTLSKKLHQKYYSQVPYAQFAAKFLERPISTITGQPMQTGAEKISQSKQALRTIGPWVGDVAGTLLAPQLKGATIPIRIANAFLRGGGAAAGAGAGEFGSQLAFGEELDPKRAGIEALMAGGGELGMSALGAGIKGAGKLALDFTVLGKHVQQKIRDRIIKNATQKAQKFMHDLAPDSIKARAINFDDIDIALERVKADKSILYDIANQEMVEAASKTGGRLNLKNTKSYLFRLYGTEMRKVPPGAKNPDRSATNRVIQSLGFNISGTKNTQHITIRKLLRNEDIEPAVLQHLLANLGTRTSKQWAQLHPSIKGGKQSFKEAILKDLESAGIEKSKLDADRLNGEIKDFEFIKRIYDRSTKTDQWGNTQVNMAELADNIYLNEANIKKIAERRGNKDLWPKMKAEAVDYKKIGEKVKESVMETRSGAGGIFFRGAGMALASKLTGSPVTGIPVAEGFGAISAWGLMTDSGRKILSSAFKYLAKPGMKAGLHMYGSPILMPAH